MQNHQTERQLEPEIKAATLNYLIQKGMLSHEQTVINEFMLDSYSRRVDLVIVSKNLSIAIEIKSEADSLLRLRGQTEKYLEYFDKVIIVAASKHIPHIIQAVPRHVAVWEVSKDRITIRQRGKIFQIKNKNKLLALMKVNELLKLCNKLDRPLPSRNRKSAEKLLKEASVCELRDAALENIKNRYKLTSSFFWKKVKSKNVLAEHIAFLSPYRDARLSRKETQREKELFWNSLSLQSNGESHFKKMLEEHDGKLFGTTPKQIEWLLAV